MGQKAAVVPGPGKTPRISSLMGPAEVGAHHLQESLSLIRQQLTTAAGGLQSQAISWGHEASGYSYANPAGIR